MPGIILNTFNPNLIFSVTHEVGCYPHFINEDAEAWRSRITFLRSE